VAQNSFSPYWLSQKLKFKIPPAGGQNQNENVKS
jgi:hypothetical protein